MNARAVAAALALVPLAALVSAGCRTDDAAHDHAHPAPRDAGPAVSPNPKRAVAHVMSASGSSVKGIVVFTAVGEGDGGGVRVLAEVSGLTPNAQHAFHVHEFGDCSAPDASSAGSHYNPDGHPHGAPGTDHHHAGDFGNLQADAAGNARLELVSRDLSIGGPRNAVIGRSVIIHAKHDDFSQPVGNAGGRIGCGVIGVAKDEAAPK